jgi:hypothetical protein
LYPEFYRSRSWGARRFNYRSIDEAAIVLTAAVRGFLARSRLRAYFKERYYKRLCEESGYYYFCDSYDSGGNSSWFKPRLAFPDDIEEYQPLKTILERPNLYSDIDPNKGPSVERNGIGKFSTKRVVTEAFLIRNEIREKAVRHQKDINLETATLGTTISWLDDKNLVHIVMDEYAIMRAAIVDNDWDKIITYMKNNPDNLLMQIYGFYNASKATVKFDNPDFETNPDAQYDSNNVIDYVSVCHLKDYKCF